MSTSTVRISNKSQKLLRDLAKQDKKTMHELLDDLIEKEMEKRFFDQLDQAYLALKSNPDEWQEELKERAEWDITLSDGLEKDEKFNDQGEVIND